MRKIIPTLMILVLLSVSLRASAQDDTEIRRPIRMLAYRLGGVFDVFGKRHG